MGRFHTFINKHADAQHPCICPPFHVSKAPWEHTEEIFPAEQLLQCGQGHTSVVCGNSSKERGLSPVGEGVCLDF